MIIKQKYINKYLLLMAVDQLIDEFQDKGYEIKTQYPILGSLRVDVFAVKGNRKVAVEFVENGASDESLQRLRQIVSGEGITLKLINVSRIRIESKGNDAIKKNKN